ncbi:podoplanin isoform 2-T2 [Symphorus nematophorus]
MNVQLLLLVALVGPFCAFTRASPTEIPTSLDEITEAAEVVPEATEAAKEELTAVTGPPSTEPPAAPEEVVTEVVTDAAPEDPVVTEEAVLMTEGPVVSTAAPGPLITEAPALETAAPTEEAKIEDEPVVTAAAEVETGGDVVIEGETEEGLSSGQVVGIVIGALLAVIIVIAVVIAAVRRMGKYS